MPEFKLKANYWDGQRLHLVGDTVSFPEGVKAPRSAVAVKTVQPAEPVEEEKEKSPEPSPDNEAELGKTASSAPEPVKASPVVKPAVPTK